MFKKQLQLKLITSAALLTTMLASAPVSACGLSAYLGQTCIIAGAYCPEGTLPAEGQLLSVNDNMALYSLLGCTYGVGGDCRVTFALPDLRGRIPVAWGQGTDLTYHNVGDSFGNESITQTLEQMPRHVHLATFTPGGSGGGTATGTVSLPVTGSVKIATGTAPASRSNTPADNSVLVPAQLTTANIYGAPGTTTDLTIGSAESVSGTASGAVSLAVSGGSGGTVTVANNGGGRAMPNVPPEIAIRYCIVTEGYYPPRP
jgi:microcystin-dependent protein